MQPNDTLLMLTGLFFLSLMGFSWLWLYCKDIPYKAAMLASNFRMERKLDELIPDIESRIKAHGDAIVRASFLNSKDRRGQPRRYVA